MKQCENCHSFAINTDPDGFLCDVCFYKLLRNRADRIKTAVLAFFQEREGFKSWWDNLDENTQSAIAMNLIDRISKIQED